MGWIIVFATFVLFLSIVTLCTFDTWQTVLLALFCVFIAMYVFLLGVDKLTTGDVLTIREGFVSDSQESKYEWLQNDELFDDF